MKSEEKIKNCCGFEVCECKIKDVEPIWRCKICNHSNFKSQNSCFYCKNNNNIPDFSASQGPDVGKAQIELTKVAITKKDSDKFLGGKPRVVQRPKGYKKQNVRYS